MSKPIVSHHEAASSSVRTYCIGFVLSLVLTITAYTLVTQEVLSSWNLIFALSGLAVTQLFVQLYFFLHLGKESKPRWKLHALLFAAMVVVIVVFGSLWIMKNLMYGHNTAPSETELIKDEGYTP